MSLKEQFDSFLAECPAIAILRGVTPDGIEEVCDILAAGGIRLLEIPLNSPNAVESVRLASACANGRYLAGAGTVLTPDDVRAVAEAGGKFIISPNTNPEVIRETVKLGLISMPGFFTASEAFTAMAAGADYLKLFPAGVMGPNYVKDLKAVVKKPILAVGGVDKNNASAFLKVCVGIGVGSALYKPGKTPDVLRADTADLMNAIQQS